MQILFKEHSDNLHACHIDMWTWISYYPRWGKLDWPGWTRPHVRKLCEVFPLISDMACFACATRSFLPEGKKDYCGAVCPIKWTSSSENVLELPCISSTGSLFNLWKTAVSNKDYVSISKIAKEIASAPWHMPE